jgi:molecular chaperone HtpG
MSEQSFTVDLGGIVDLLSSHLYSGPQVFIRELLQNGVDAVTARKAANSNHPGSIKFICSDSKPNTIVVVDDGVGLTAEQAATFMGVIGRSSKRDEIGLARESMIGQFGVGILSCFAVSDEIVVSTVSMLEEVATLASDANSQSVEWTGRATGKWGVRSTTRSGPIGTTVTLTARRGDERWFTPATVLHWLRHYGELAQIPVWFCHNADTPVLINRVDIPTRQSHPTQSELIEFGSLVLDFEPLYAFPIESRVSQTKGIVYVLPFEPAPSARRYDRVYVKGMLLSDQCQSLLPDWAFFVRGIFEANGLHPTASREDLHADELLTATREELGHAVRNHLLSLATEAPAVLNQMIDVHHLSLAALAIADEEFLRLVGDWLPLMTAEGNRTLGQLRREHPIVSYAKTVDEFRQASAIARHQGIGLVNAGFVHVEGLLNAAAAVYDSFSVQPIVIEDLFRTFGELTEPESRRMAELKLIAIDRLKAFHVDCEIKTFEPWESPSILAVSDGAAQLRSLRRLSEQSNDLFASVITAMEDHAPASRPLLCLNARNPIVELLATKTHQRDLVERGVEVLYLQALLSGQHPMRTDESALLNISILDLLKRAAS